MAVTRDTVDVALAGKGLVGLVHHEQSALRANGQDDALDHRVVPQIGSRVVRVGQVNNGRLVRGDGRQHGCFVQFKISRQRHADESQALQLRAHGVHDEAGHGCQHLGAGHIASQRQQRDQLVRAVAQHDVKALGHLRISGQRPAQVIDAPVRVAVERQRAQSPAKLSLQLGGQPVRVLHGI